MKDINHFFEFADILKALAALACGLILGFEREMKDKSAGLKTISIICLGSTLFTVLSYKMGLGESEDSTRIASYVVSGIGFLGAGVIYKEGFTVYGLTTAGIIWISAAIGMSIGFGEFYLGFTFLVTTLIIIYGTRLLGKKILPKFNNKSLHIEIGKDYANQRTEIFKEIKSFTKQQTVYKFEKLENENIAFHLDIKISNQQTIDLEEFLLQRKEITSFSM